MSTHLQDNEPEITASSGMKVALIGPNEAHRKIVAKALAGSEARSVREFVDYPANLSDLPKMLDQPFDVIMIDVDSDESYALKLVETVAGITSAVVMVYSRRNDPDLLMSCMRAGARDFLPLPEDPLAQQQSASGPQLVQPETRPEPRPAPPAAPPAIAQPEARPIPSASHSFSAPPVEPPAYVPPIDRGVPEPRIDEFPVRGFVEAGQGHSLQQDIDEWDEAHLRAPEPTVARIPVPPPPFSAAPEPVTFKPEPVAFRTPEPIRAPEPVKTPEPEEKFPIEAFLKTPEPSVEPFRKAPETPIESFRRAPETPVREVVETRRFESQPQPPQATEQPKDSAAASTSFDEWDSAFLRTPQTSANNGITASPRATVTSIPRPQPVPAPKAVPEPPAPRQNSTADLFVASTETDTTAGPPDTSVLSASRPKIDRTNIPMFQYEVPEEEKKPDRKWILWVSLAAGLAAVACALIFVFANPFHHNSVQPASQAQPVAQQPQAPSAWQPVASENQPASTPASAKPSAATPIAGAQVTVAAPAPAPVNAVSSGMMDAQLAAPSRIAGNVKADSQVEEGAPAGFTAASLDNGGANVSGAVFGGENKVTILPGVHAISSGVAEGMLIRKVDPIYPKFARDSRVSGTVVLKATITKTGSISGLEVVSGPRILSEAAVNAVRFWRYRPYLLNGEPVDVQTTINVVFKLDN
jgi:periplasmic protein TonB